MKTKIEMTNKKIQYNNDNNKLTRGRKMKYSIIMLTLMVAGLVGRNTEPTTNWFYDQTILQSFYMLEEATIDGDGVEGNNCGVACSDGTESDCYTSGTCDVVGAFRTGVCADTVYQYNQQLCELFST